MSTPALVILIAATAWAAIVGMLGALDSLDRHARLDADLLRVRAGHDLTPIVLAHTPRHCRLCRDLYDQETTEGIAQAEEWANRGESA